MASFQHVALSSKNHFRVLHLHPSTFEPGILVFDIEEVVYADPPAYSAISYTWDGQSQEIDALCNNNSFRITKNCSRILTRLRKPTSTITVWMDQICIDQGSDVDKSMNVGRMDEIYMKSAEVLIWLSGIDHDAAQRLQRAEKEFHRSRHWDGQSSPQKFFPPDMNYSWFKRMWTLQEAAIPAHDHILLLVGSESVPLFNPGLTTDNRSISLLQQIQSHLRFSAGNEPLYTLSALLLVAIDRQCYDPRDKIFALYGIIRRISLKTGPSISNSNGVPFPAPDYRKTVSQVYIESAAWALSQQDMGMLKLTALSDSQRARTQATALLPSWVPDLARITRAMAGCPHLQRARDPLLWHTDPFQLSDQRKHAMPLYNSSNNTLTIVGTQAGAVIMASQELPEFLDYGINEWAEAPIRQFLEVCAKFMEDTRASPFKFSNNYFAALFDQSSVFNILLNNAFWMNKWSSKNCDITRQSNLAIESLKIVIEPGDPSSDCWNTLQEKGLPEYHTMFLTSEGYLGISLGTPRIGDKVVIMESMEQLLLLRDTDEVPYKCYRFVGTADVPKLQKRRRLRLDEEQSEEQINEGAIEEEFILL